MSLPPTVGIYIPTYERAHIVHETVERLRRWLVYDGVVQIVVGCDGLDDTAERLRESECVILREPSGSLGANVNRMVAMLRKMGVVVMMGLDDDHHLRQPLDLNRHVEKLIADETAGRIHLLMEAKNDEHFDRYKFVATLDDDHYWRVHWDCAEQFVMSFRPHLVHDRWWQVMGMLAEGKPTGPTEWEYSRRTKMKGVAGCGVNVLVPLRAAGAETWAHVGESWNRRGL